MRRAAMAAALVMLALAGCSGGDDSGIGSGDLVWTDDPLLVTPPALPGDRILAGTVRNDSLRRIDIVARDLTLRTAGGDEIPGTKIFNQTYERTVFPRNRGDATPVGEELRIGLRASIQPGKEAPLTVAWHARDGRPARIEYGFGSLPVPRG
ncbi:MAG TPA: hypothetical protein VGF25_10795 [Thermoleophilaceae bacterium]